MWSFERIAQELGVSKPTLINWSRKYQLEIQNQRAMLLGSEERWLSDCQARVNLLVAHLRKVGADLANRDISELNTRQLFCMADSLRRQIQRKSVL